MLFFSYFQESCLRPCGGEGSLHLGDAHPWGSSIQLPPPVLCGQHPVSSWHWHCVYIPPEVCGQTGREWYYSGHEEEGPGGPRGQSDAILQESLRRVSPEDVRHSEQPRSHKWQVNSKRERPVWSVVVERVKVNSTGYHNHWKRTKKPLFPSFVYLLKPLVNQYSSLTESPIFLHFLTVETFIEIRLYFVKYCDLCLSWRNIAKLVKYICHKMWIEHWTKTCLNFKNGFAVMGHAKLSIDLEILCYVWKFSRFCFMWSQTRPYF